MEWRCCNSICGKDANDRMMHKRGGYLHVIRGPADRCMWFGKVCFCHSRSMATTRQRKARKENSPLCGLMSIGVNILYLIHLPTTVAVARSSFTTKTPTQLPPVPSLRQIGKTISILAIRVYQPPTKDLPLSTEYLHCLLEFFLSEAAVLQTPLRELLPPVHRHPRVADHNLIEFVRERGAIE